MSNIVITDSNRFKEITDNFKTTVNNIENIFNSVDEDLKEISGVDTWKSDLQEKTYLKYNELSNNYESIINSLNDLSGFLDKTINAYETFEKTTISYMEDNSSSMDVNG